MVPGVSSATLKLAAGAEVSRAFSRLLEQPVSETANAASVMWKTVEKRLLRHWLTAINLDSINAYTIVEYAEVPSFAASALPSTRDQ